MQELATILCQRHLRPFLQGHRSFLLCPLILQQGGQFGRRSGLHIGCWEESREESIEEEQT